MFSALKLFLFICWLLGNLFIFIWEVSIVDIFCCVFVYTFFLFLFFVLCVFFVFVLLFYSLFGGWGLWGELISFFLRIICFCLKSWFLISVSLNTKCALWLILMQLKMTFVRPITSVTPWPSFYGHILVTCIDAPTVGTQQRSLDSKSFFSYHL